MDEHQDTEDLGCIVGAVVQLQTDETQTVFRQLAACNGVDIHAKDKQARVVITIEATSSKEVLKTTEYIQNIQGVVAVTPVYQYAEENQSQDEQRGWQWR